MSDKYLLVEIEAFSPVQQAAFQRGGLTDVVELFIDSPAELAKRCRVQLRDVQDMLDTATRALTTKTQRLSDVLPTEPTVFTTGDAALDRMLGGGVRTGMVWELFGEGASGKTQLALQLALTVQLPPLGGAAVYLTTSSALPTPRLLELATTHPILHGTSLAHVHTLETRTVDALLSVLSGALPALLKRNPGGRRVRLLVIDALADLFREDTRTTTKQLVARSRSLADVSRALHALASAHALAVIVLNHVVDSFKAAPARARTELVYAEHARLFASGDTPAEARKKAALGLVWANQLNARIMLTRTGRRRAFEARDGMSKRRRVDGTGAGTMQAAGSSSHPLAEDMLVRRLSILFSSVSAPASADFIVVPHGVELLDGDVPASFPDAHRAPTPAPATATTSASQLGDVAPLDVACAAQASSPPPEPDAGAAEPPVEVEVEVRDEDEEAYWGAATGMEDVWDAVAQSAAF